jgi:hypothetical protein
MFSGVGQLTVFVHHKISGVEHITDLFSIENSCVVAHKISAAPHITEEKQHCPTKRFQL